MNRDFVEILSALIEARAEFLVVGAHALAAYGTPRATGDLDIWINPTRDNAERVLKALAAFGAPLFDLAVADLTASETVFQIGVPPARIDILAGITGVAFTDAWPRRLNIQIDGLAVPVIGREDFIVNKRATGRPKDISDLTLLPPE